MQDFLQHLFAQYPIWAPAIFIVARIAAIVIPPIPGLVVDLLGIATFGWVKGFILAEVAITLGSTLAFLAGRLFREPLVKRFVTLQNLHKWEDEMSENKKFWYLVGLRFFTSPFFDYLSYAAGLTRLSWQKFTLTTFIGTLPSVLSVYYFGDIFLGKGVIVGALFILLTIVAGYAFKQYSTKRYR